MSTLVRAYRRRTGNKLVWVRSHRRGHEFKLVAKKKLCEIGCLYAHMARHTRNPDVRAHFFQELKRVNRYRRFGPCGHPLSTVRSEK